MRSFCSALNMSDSHSLRSAVRADSIGSSTPSASYPTPRCDAAVRREPAPPPGVDVASVKARKEQDMRDEKGRKVETAVEARAGFLDRPVLVVLCVSLALGVLVLGALWFGFYAPGACARAVRRSVPRQYHHFGRGR